MGRSGTCAFWPGHAALQGLFLMVHAHSTAQPNSSAAGQKASVGGGRGRIGAELTVVALNQLFVSAPPGNLATGAHRMLWNRLASRCKHYRSCVAS